MIINSLLDTDLYKLTMQQAVIAVFPHEIVRYELIIRTPREFPESFGEALKQEISRMSNLALQKQEAEFLAQNCLFLKLPYIDFLRGYRFDPEEIQISQQGNRITLIIEGYWYRTILWEVPLMALISELYFKMTGQQPEPQEVLAQRMTDKAMRLEKLGARFSDFGTRRRFSFLNQDLVVDCCKKNAPSFFSGTSNVSLAMKYQCKAIGTQAHEWYMGIAAIYGYKQANRIGMEKWTDVYQGDLGIALTDTFTTDVFFAGFDMKFAKLFDGIRHDSGDPLVFAEKAIRHYEKLRIDPLGKIVVFSDSLNVDMVERIENFCKGKIRTSYGIGTNLTNDVGVKPLNMVIKLTAVKVDEVWVPTVKLSDDSGKHTGEKDAVALCKQVLGVKDFYC